LRLVTGGGLLAACGSYPIPDAYPPIEPGSEVVFEWEEAGEARRFVQDLGCTPDDEAPGNLVTFGSTVSYAAEGDFIALYVEEGLEEQVRTVGPEGPPSRWFFERRPVEDEGFDPLEITTEGTITVDGRSRRQFGPGVWLSFDRLGSGAFWGTFEGVVCNDGDPDDCIEMRDGRYAAEYTLGFCR
ncbi:MAG: hypothetical protein AAF211_01735, partial [Myxococcota bacterium]